MPTLTVSLPDTTFVSSAQPDTNLSYYPLIYTGTDLGFGTCMGLIQISLPFLPVPSVLSALLQLSVVVKSDTSPSPVTVGRVNDSFRVQAVTYNTRPACTATTSQYNVLTSDLYTAIQIDVTDLVNGWLGGTYTNNGLALTNSDGISIVQFGTNKITYEPYFPRLILTYSNTPVSTACSYGLVYNTGNQAVATANSIPLDHNGPMSEITHQAGSGQITITKEGLYSVLFFASGQSANQLVLYQNEAVLLSSISGTASGTNSAAVTVNAAAGDVVSLRNCTGSTLTLNNKTAGPQKNVSASMFLKKIGPIVKPESALAAVNAAQASDTMRTAIVDPSLGLILTGFNALLPSAQSTVLTGLLQNRPTLGYLTVPDLQDMLDYQVALVQKADLNNIYVRAGTTGGNGSIALPFGDIQSGINTVNSYGTVHIESGNYNIRSTITIRKNGVRLSGVSDSKVTVNALALTFIKASASDVVIDGLTFIVNNPTSTTTFLALAGNHISATNNTMYSNLADPIVAISISDNMKNVVVSSNTIHTTETGIDIAPGASCRIENNQISDSTYGIFVWSEQAEISGNHWEGDPNSCDILLYPGLPYDPNVMSVQNDQAKMCDLSESKNDNSSLHAQHKPQKKFFDIWQHVGQNIRGHLSARSGLLSPPNRR